MVVVGKNLLSPGNVARRPFQVDGIRSQVNIDIQAVFQQAHILVARAEQSLDVGTDFNALLHSVFGASSRALDAELPVRGAQKHPCPGVDKRFSYLWVEPAEDARPEVQATAIELRVPLLNDESQCGRIEFFTLQEPGSGGVRRTLLSAGFDFGFRENLGPPDCFVAAESTSNAADKSVLPHT